MFEHRDAVVCDEPRPGFAQTERERGQALTAANKVGTFGHARDETSSVVAEGKHGGARARYAPQKDVVLVDAVLPADVAGEDGNIGQMPARCLSLLETRSGDGVFTNSVSSTLSQTSQPGCTYMDPYVKSCLTVDRIVL